MNRPITFFLPLISLLVLTLQVDGHGCMVSPCIRGILNTNSIFNNMPKRKDLSIPIEQCRKMKTDLPADTCPHCSNAGGKGAVMALAKNNWIPYKPLDAAAPFRRDSGLCGDPKKGARDHEAGGKFGWPKSPIVATYKQNSIVEFVVDLTTNHQGFFEYFICDASKCGGDINEKCFKDGHCHQMKRAKTPACESATSKECAPIDPKYPGRWYVGCRVGGHVGEHFVGGKYMRYHLPKGFNTAHAVIQFYWVTANSCNPPGFIDYFKKYPMDAWNKCPGDGGTMGGRNPTIVECGGKNFPEEFWNCADVAVTSSGAAGTVPVAPEPPAPVATAPAVPEPAPPAPVTTAPAVPEPTPTTPVTPAMSEPPAAAPATAAPAVTAPVEPQPAAVATSAPTQAPRDMAKETAWRDAMHGEEEDDYDDMKSLSNKKGSTKGMCVKRWHMCGGKFHKGPTICCTPEFYCKRHNKWFSHCAKRR